MDKQNKRKFKIALVFGFNAIMLGMVHITMPYAVTAIITVVMFFNALLSAGILIELFIKEVKNG